MGSKKIHRRGNGCFTQKPIHPYTYKVTQCHLSFTTEFKELFWKHYNEGMTPKDILVSLGYDPDVLGENRVNGIRMHMQLRNEVEYLRQEVEFLKKFHQ